MNTNKIPDVVEFNRPAKYKSIGVLGRGACGETVHIFDEAMQCDFAAKKYKPIVSKKNDPVFLKSYKIDF